MSDAPASYQPSAYFFRKALRGARSKAEAVDVGLQVVRELEALKAFVRENGLIPPKRHVLKAEAQAKQWAVE